MKCRKISIANHKGGVGKTVTSINLSACLAKKNRKVLLIDLDPQANATRGVGIEWKDLKRSIYDSLLSGELSREAPVMTSVDNLYLIPSCLWLLAGCTQFHRRDAEESQSYLLR